MGVACRTHGSYKCIYYFRLETLREEHFKDLGVVGRIILEWILRKYGGKMWTV
jgi:hypothetical protein